MRTTRLFVVLAALATAGAFPEWAAPLAAQSAEPLPPPLRRERSLTCRGGPGLVFDTLAADSAKTQLSLAFTAVAGEAGLEGQGLEPGQCGWVERAFGEREPRRILLSISASDTTPRQSMLDGGVYWGFLAYTTDSGFIRAVGYRHWHASSPPAPYAAAGTAEAAGTAPARRRSGPLPFDVRYLPLFAVGMAVIIGIPATAMLGRWSGWRQLAERYPDRNAGRGRSFRSGPLVMNKSVYKMGVRFTMDESHLHFRMSLLARPGHPPFSLPWREIEASRDEWPWFPLKGEPMVRLTIRAYPGIRILVRMRDGKRIAAASGGQLAIDGMREAAVAVS